MKTTDTFGIIVRTVGLIVVVSSPGFLALGMETAAGPLFLFGLLVFPLGLWLLRGARSVVSFAYPEEAQAPATGADPDAAANTAAPLG